MEVPRHWRLRKQRYALVGQVCPHCEVKIFPPRDVCLNCGGETSNRYSLVEDKNVFSVVVMTETPLTR